MIAIFTGKDYMKWKYGETYHIRSKIEKVHIGGNTFGEDKVCICIHDDENKIVCPYDSIEAFIKNWIILKGDKNI